MKTPVAVALIIMGALLITVPVQSDSMYQHNLVELLIDNRNVDNTILIGPMSDFYRFACWATGTGLIAIAVLCSLTRNSSSLNENR